MWVDPNLSDFYNRVSRIEKSHAAGHGFEAAGTISHITKPRNRWRMLKLIKNLVLSLALGIGLKGMIHFYIGAQTYESRVSALASGEGIDPVGAWLMQADPLTLWVSAQLRGFLYN